jgi:hypothetical protein
MTLEAIGLQARRLSIFRVCVVGKQSYKDQSTNVLFLEAFEALKPDG